MQKLYKTSLNLVVKTGDSEKLFGSVTKEDIAEAIAKEIGINVDKHDILLDEPIKNTGAYMVEVRLKLENFPDEQPKIAQVKIWVIGEK